MYLRAQFGHGRLPKASEAIMSYIAISIIYNGFLHIFGFEVVKSNQAITLYDRISLLLYTFLFPVLVGFVSGISYSSEWFYNLLRSLNLNVVHPMPTAWDYCFMKSQESWVLVKLKNGKEIRGKFSNKSFVSSIPEERDLYIEKICLPNGKKPWKVTEDSILISRDEISVIEFTPINS